MPPDAGEGLLRRKGNREVGAATWTEHDGGKRASLARDTAGAAQVSPEPDRFLDHDEVPKFMQRPFILQGYQCGGGRAGALRRTLLGFNNETLNAYTMIFGGGFAAYLFWSYRSAYMDVCPAPFVISIVATLLHVPLSVGFHCLRTVSEADRLYWRTLDALGVITSVVIRCSMASVFLFTDRALFVAYLAAVALALGAFVGMLLWGGTLKKLPKSQQATCIVAVALLASLPLLIESVREVVQDGWPGVAALGSFRMAGLGIVGGGIYALHGPERWLPGWFCYVGCSHQIMHILVMGIPLCELSLMLSFLEQGRVCML